MFQDFEEDWQKYIDVVKAAVPRLTGDCERYYARAMALRDNQARHVLPKPVPADRRDDAPFCQAHFESTKREVNMACGVHAEQVWNKRYEQTAHMDDERWAEWAGIFRDQARGNANRGLSPKYPGLLPEFGFGTRISGIEGHWVAAGKLGEGGNGTAYLCKFGRYQHSDVSNRC